MAIQGGRDIQHPAVMRPARGYRPFANQAPSTSGVYWNEPAGGKSTLDRLVNVDALPVGGDGKKIDDGCLEHRDLIAAIRVDAVQIVGMRADASEKYVAAAERHLIAAAHQKVRRRVGQRSVSTMNARAI